MVNQLRKLKFPLIMSRIFTSVEKNIFLEKINEF